MNFKHVQYQDINSEGIITTDMVLYVSTFRRSDRKKR